LNILGIDYGISNTGYTVADLSYHVLTAHVLTPLEMSVIQTKPSHKKQKIYVEDDNIIRVKYIVKELVRIIKKYDIKIITIEAFTTNPKNSNVNRKNYGIVSVIATISEIFGIPLFTVTPHQIKIGIANKKSASKDEIIEIITKKYPETLKLKPKAKGKHEHCYDGFATIITALKEYQIITLLR
jgi:Holliday junction resolvasome RuvABC endonuclease subunit